MTKNSFLITIFVNISLVLGYTNQKCCETGQSIIAKNSSFQCEISVNLRIQSNFENTDFFSKNISGSCIDIFSQNKTAIFAVDVTTKTISKKDDLNVRYFRKCCPLRQKYNKITHSCVKSNKSDYEKILKDNSFIKIGLPQCKIISDDFFHSSVDFQRVIDGIISKNSRVLSDNLCVDSTLQGDFVIRKCEENDQICGRIRCIHKCCPDGQSYVNGSNCFDTFEYGVDLHWTNKIHDPDAPFVVIHGIQKPIHVLFADRYNFSIDKTGLFSIHSKDIHSNFPVSHNKYCMEHAKAGRLNGYYFFATASKPELKKKFTLTIWAKVMSCICLLLTILVYVIVPKMRNLFGNILLSYSVATFLMFLFLGFSLIFHDSFNDLGCQVIGYLNILTVLWSFTWLHIMCIDIWFSFRTPRSVIGPLQKNEMKTMLKYILLGWGLPIVWIIVIALLNLSERTPPTIRPYIGEMKCFIEGTDTREGNYAHILFVVLPLSIQQIINTLLFISTIRYYLRMERMRDMSSRKNLRIGKERLIMIVKLTVIMGNSFLFETISSLFDFSSNIVTEYIEIVWDSINCLQGVFIFVAFICKKKVYNYICEVIPCLQSRKITAVSSSATQHFSLQQIEEHHSL